MTQCQGQGEGGARAPGAPPWTRHWQKGVKTFSVGLLDVLGPLASVIPFWPQLTDDTAVSNA